MDWLIILLNVLLFNLEIVIGDLALQVLVAPSLVAPGRGLFLSIYDDIDDESDKGGDIEEIIIPQGKFKLISFIYIICEI